MKTKAPSFFSEIRSDEDKNRALEQYRILCDTIAKSNEIRETSNNFWIAVNTFGVSVAGFLMNTDKLYGFLKTTLVVVVLVMGVVFCMSWFSSLLTIKRTIEVRNDLITEIEQYLPIKAFRHYFYYTGRQRGYNSLTARELMVPGAFLFAYAIFALVLMIYGHQVVEAVQSAAS